MIRDFLLYLEKLGIISVTVLKRNLGLFRFLSKCLPRHYRTSSKLSEGRIVFWIRLLRSKLKSVTSC